MTNNEIIKALECCKVAPQNCDNCPMLNAECQQGLPKVALDLINQQQTRIKNLDFCYGKLSFDNINLTKELKTAKAEAIKEFAEKLKKRFYLIAGRCVVNVYQIDNLVKEMVGEE